MLYLTTFGSSVWHGPAAGVPNAFEDVYPLNPLGAPRITWVTPNGGSIFSRAVPVRLIAAAAVVSGGINQVEFFQNRMSLGFGEPIPIPPASRAAAHGAGYRYFVLVWSNPPAGTYNLKAQVTDTAGAVTLSGNVKDCCQLTNQPLLRRKLELQTMPTRCSPPGLHGMSAAQEPPT